MNRWIAIGKLIEKLDKAKRWVRIRKFVANRIMYWTMIEIIKAMHK